MFAVIIPVGPGDRELARLNALTEELRRHESESEIDLVVVDDAPQPRSISLSWPRVSIIRTAVRATSRPDLFSAHVAGTLEALGEVQRAGDEFALKLDTDAAVLRPFSTPLRATFSDPEVGVVGSYDRTSTGAGRDWSMWRSRLDRADRPIAVRRVGRGLRVVCHTPREREHVRLHRQRAYGHAPPGAHCLGGAYAVSGAFLGRADLSWRPWIGTGLGEDVVVGLLCASAGLQMRSLTAPGEPFALSWRGLPGSPREIADARHAIVHSVKAETEARESALRDELQSEAAVADARITHPGEGPRDQSP